MGLSKNPEPIDRFDNIPRGWGRLGFGGFSEQTGGVRINPHTMCGNLAGKFGLELQPDFNGDGHQQPLSSLPLPYQRQDFRVKRIANQMFPRLLLS